MTTAPGLPWPPTVVVVGGGIAGLVAARRLARALGAGASVVLVEASARTGGKLRTGEVGGVRVDLGAESLLARRPEAVALAREVGLGDDLVAPATTSASLWSRGRLRPLPRGTVMGVPADLRALAASGVLSAGALARVPLDHLLAAPPVEGDVAVGAYVGQRLGREVVDRLVEPLLGGVYAGHADELSLAATVPALAVAARRGGSLLEALRPPRSTRAPAASAPTLASSVFAGVAGGIGRLAEAVAADARAAGVEVRIATAVSALRRTPAGWRVELRATPPSVDPGGLPGSVLPGAGAPGPSGTLEALDADAVVLAVPAPAAAALLRPEVPAAAAALDGTGYADVAIVTIAVPRAAVPASLRGSGLLVPPVERRTIKAATFSFRKWAWLDASSPDLALLRASVGRAGEDDLGRGDADLVAQALQELRLAAGLRAPAVDAAVTRWTGGLPQYAVGHLDRVAAVRAALPPGLAVCGAAYDGVGVPAVVASAGLAADRVRAGLQR